MATGLLVVLLMALAAVKILLQGYFDIMNSIIIILGFMWIARRYSEKRALKKRREQEEKIEQFMGNNEIIDVTETSEVKEEE